MKQLWAPWRMDFISKPTKEMACVFCQVQKAQTEKADRENLVLFRADHCFVILNKYPYNNGHLMVVPKEHTADITGLASEVFCEIFEMTQHSVKALAETYQPHAFNLGMNLGHSAGAGIKDHLHQHIVPRWNGDTNFMPVIAETKAMPQHIFETFDRIEPYFRRLSS